jgi:hypothetical protein
MNYPTANHRVQAILSTVTPARLRRLNSGGCPEKSVLIWIPAFAGMTRPQQAAENGTHRDPISKSLMLLIFEAKEINNG